MKEKEDGQEPSDRLDARHDDVPSAAIPGGSVSDIEGLVERMRKFLPVSAENVLMLEAAALITSREARIKELEGALSAFVRYDSGEVDLERHDWERARAALGRKE